jgi:glutamyl-tRNA reductase
MNSILDTYQLLTVTHKTATLKKVGDYVVNLPEGEQLQDFLQQFKAKFGLEELLYVPTCNRVIFLFTGEKVKVNSFFIKEFFQHINPNLTLSRIHDEVAYYFGEYAINHIYSVAASIDSLVIGERQILKQLRESYEDCIKWQLAGDNIKLLMRYTVTVAKRVYAQTRIGEKPVSVVSLAIKKLLEAQVSKKSRILLIGAGQTNLLVSKFLTKYDYKNVIVFNRTVERAQKLAQKFTGEYAGLEELSSYQKGFDILIVCTGSTQPIITKALYSTLIGEDTSKKVIIDLANPNNTTLDVVDGFNVNYIDIDSLQALAEKNMEFRQREVNKAQEIIQEEIADYTHHFKQRQIEKAMREIPVQIKQVKSHAINQVFRKEIETLDESTKELMERMLTYMEKKCISIPMTIAKDVMLNQEATNSN